MCRAAGHEAVVQALHQNSHMLIQLARDLHSERSTLPTNVEPRKPCGSKEASFGAPGPKGVRHFHLQRNQWNHKHPSSGSPSNENYVTIIASPCVMSFKANSKTNTPSSFGLIEGS